MLSASGRIKMARQGYDGGAEHRGVRPKFNKL